MLIVLATGFHKLGGVATYTLTVAEQLERLGHEVLVAVDSTGAERIVAERGIRAVSRARDLPGSCDAVLVQDEASAYEMAERYPGAPRIMVPHMVYPGREFGPQLPGACSAVVALNDRVGRRYESLARHPEIVRLRQPIDLDRFSPSGPRRGRPHRVLAFGNQMTGPGLRALEQACERLGLELHQIGRHGEVTSTPEVELFEADIVVGVGRCALEGMAMARATYVYGLAGGDGWVSPDTYPELEADGFAGRATSLQASAARVEEDLRRWSPDMGLANRGLVLQHHDAPEHAIELVTLFERLGAGARGADAAGEDSGGPQAGLREMARLVRLSRQYENRAGGYARRNLQAIRRTEALERERDRIAADRDRLTAERNELANALHARRRRRRRLRRTVYRLSRVVERPQRGG